MKNYPMLIGGQSAETENTIEVINPATGQPIGLVPQADNATIQSVLTAAKQGFEV